LSPDFQTMPAGFGLWLPLILRVTTILLKEDFI